MLAKLYKKEQKKCKKIQKAFITEVDSHQKTKQALSKLREEVTKHIEDLNTSDEKLVKAHSSYTELYDQF